MKEEKGEVESDSALSVVLPRSPLNFSHFPSIPPPVPVRLTELDDHACPYLPGRVAKSRAFWADRMDGAIYRQFMDAAFRRSGKVVYQPICAGCRQCVPIRIPVKEFTPSKSQRRCWRKNADLLVSVGAPKLTDEKVRLYQKYTAKWHGAADEKGAESVDAFLYQSPVDTLEYEYRSADGTLLAVGICDVDQISLSSVYFYFDPDQQQRGLGTFGALYELAHAKDHSISYFYLGYWIKDCTAMRYKSSFTPHQILGADGVWRDHR